MIASLGEDKACKIKIGQGGIIGYAIGIAVCNTTCAVNSKFSSLLSRPVLFLSR